MGCGASTAAIDSKALPLSSEEERRRYEEAVAAARAEAKAEAAKEVRAANKEAQELRLQLQGAQEQLKAAQQEAARLRAQVAGSCGVPAPPPAAPAAPPLASLPVPPAAAAAAVQEAAGLHRNTDATALQLLSHVAEHVPLTQLPPVIRDLHGGMPSEIAGAPMRLMHMQAVVDWGGRIKVYEEVAASECLDLPYADVTEDMWAATAALSWRWGAPKPASHQPGFSPMLPSQSEKLVEALGRLAGSGLQYVWIDWCCVPQYSAPSMVEVLRSKVFYARARVMLVVPTFHPLPLEGIIRPLLARAQQLLDDAAAAGGEGSSASDARAAAAALGSMLAKEQMACREYLSRVWTLAERLARHGRNEPLSCWVGLEAWLGMVADAVLAAGGVAHACHGQRVDDPKATVALYLKVLDAAGAAGDAAAAEDAAGAAAAAGGIGANGGGSATMEGHEGGGSSSGTGSGGRALVEALSPLLSAASATGSLLGDGVKGLDALFVDLLLAGARLWRLARLGEAPTASWLLGYLSDMQAGMYQAWADADRVWAVYSYYSWKKPDVASPEALAEAVKDLVAVAGGGAEHLAVAGSKLGLGARRLAAIAGVLGLGELEDAERARAKALGHELIKAAVAGDAAEVRRLLCDGADLDTQDGATPLHSAAEKGHTETVKVLLSAGAAPDTADQFGQTPLNSAAADGHTETVNVLLAAGAAPDTADRDGATPLNRAAADGHTETVNVLLAAGAGPDTADQYARTPLNRAAVGGHIETVKVLLSAGAAPDTADRRDGATPLHSASGKGHTETVKVLLAAGAALETVDEYGRTPVNRASGTGHTEAIKVLLAAGAAPDTADLYGRVPLWYAAEKGHIETVKVLLSAGAAPGTADKNGYAPLDVARMTEIKELLGQAST